MRYETALDAYERPARIRRALNPLAELGIVILLVAITWFLISS